MLKLTDVFDPAQYNFDYRVILASLACLIIGIYISLNAGWPEIYVFASDPDASHIMRLLQSPVHLADDVMISLRSGYMINEVGYPAFNRTDLAQASTSYASPYLFSLLLKVLQENVAVAVYAFLGFLSVVLTLWAILLTSRSFLNAIIIVIGLTLTTTNMDYVLKGWDHLFSGLFLTSALLITLRKPSAPLSILSASLFLALGVLFRLDGIIIAIAILFVMFLKFEANIISFIKYGLAPFVIMVSIFFIANFYYFGFLLPTTARLKIGASPSLEYALYYIVNNGLMSFSVITVIFFLLLFYALCFRLFLGTKLWPVIIGCVATVVVAAINSDVFGGGRMFWVSACVLVAALLYNAPPLFHVNWSRLNSSFVTISPKYVSQFSPLSRKSMAVIMLAFVVITTSGTLISKVKSKVRAASITVGEVSISPTAAQYIVSHWIDANLNPVDGPVGFFYLGVSYHLPRFEIVDFLGKADELIANLPVKWGPPGHNKWDISQSLDKWNPQAIVPAGPSDPKDNKQNQRDQNAILKQSNFGFSPSLRLNEKIKQDYIYCFILDGLNNVNDNWGFYLRRDIASRYLAQLNCVSSI